MAFFIKRIVFLLLALLLPTMLKADQAVLSPAVLPLKSGHAWIYQGVTRWTKPGTGQVLEKKLTWKMQVVEVLQREFITAAIVKGHPADLLWYEDGRERGDYLILSVAQQKFYLVEGPRVAQVLARLRNEGDNLIGIVEDYELFLESPLRLAQTFGALDPVEHTEQMYTWLVESEAPVDLPFIHGLESTQKQYRLVQRTMPDDTTVDFVPGVGIVRFQYNHHGTVAQTDVKLVKCLQD